MKNHRFLWLRNRTTDNRKCEKARNIKEKRTIEMLTRSQSSSSCSAVQQEIIISQENYNSKRLQTSETSCFWGFFYPRIFIGCPETW